MSSRAASAGFRKQRNRILQADAMLVVQRLLQRQGNLRIGKLATTPYEQPSSPDKLGEM
jgi:hypothetical protein